MSNSEDTQWFVMRDLKRRNAKDPAYKKLQELGVHLFVPMKWHIALRKGVRIREEIPFLQDLLFVRDTRLHLDPIVERIPTLQYRWLRNTYRQPMTVPDAEMEQFILAVNSSESPKFFLPEEITPAMCGRQIRIIGGPLNGFEGSLLTTRGSKVKRLLVQLDGFLAVGADVRPEFIQLI